MQLIECVPNFSEGRDLNIIKQITNEIENVEGVSLLNIRPRKSNQPHRGNFCWKSAICYRSGFQSYKESRRIN